MNKPQLIRLIHIAKGQLALDDETYRLKLLAAVGKTSCSAMTLSELTTVYQSFQEAGFKRRFTKKTGALVSPNAKGQTKAPEIPKIRAIWIAMHQQGFVNLPDESSLNEYVMRQTKKINSGIGVAQVGWLNANLAYKVLESLKGWHLRVMLASLKSRRIALPVDEHDRERRTYDWIAPMYARIHDLEQYLQRCREQGEHLIATSCTRCGFRYEVVAPTDRAEKWDSVMCCAACGTQFFRTITCHSVTTRAAR